MTVEERAEMMAKKIAEALNGGEFNDGKWYTEGQREAWIKAVMPYAEDINFLKLELATYDGQICA